MRCVLTTPLGVPVDPEVNSSFATVSAPMAAKARATALSSRVARSSAQGRTPRTCSWPDAAMTTAVCRSSMAASAAANRGASATYITPGFRVRTMALSLPKSFDIKE